jgi:hypothetical protein
LVANIKHKIIKRGQEANANVDSALQQIANLASGALAINAVQDEVMSPLPFWLKLQGFYVLNLRSRHLALARLSWIHTQADQQHLSSS